MSSIGFTCDVCGRTVQGCTFVNGMKFCAKCYQETFGNNYSQTDIINAQYTEHLLKENTQLKEQLAIREKALEIAGLQKAKTFNPNGNLKELAKMYAFDFIEQAKENIK